MFKIQDLYVSLSSEDQALGWRGPFTRTATTVKSTAECVYLQKIGKLKAYLVRALAVVDGLEEETEQSEKPQTVAEVEMLEEKLRGAIDELRARKVELESEAA